MLSVEISSSPNKYIVNCWNNKLVASPILRLLAWTLVTVFFHILLDIIILKLSVSYSYYYFLQVLNMDKSMSLFTLLLAGLALTAKNSFALPNKVENMKDILY